MIFLLLLEFTIQATSGNQSDIFARAEARFEAAARRQAGASVLGIEMSTCSPKAAANGRCGLLTGASCSICHLDIRRRFVPAGK